MDLANVAATLTMRIAADPVMDAMLKLVNCAYAVHSRVTDRRRLYLPSRDAAMGRLLEQFEDAEGAVRNAFRDDLWEGSPCGAAGTPAQREVVEGEARIRIEGNRPESLPSLCRGGSARRDCRHASCPMDLGARRQ
ncbi:hypothetical protein [Streptomyces sp. MBT84]|uniref:hypothetical protein n=1 Tax=Streptomyces sp. MBT84 TaxID=1488414 RepID=UPI001C6E92DB|nr:hypothetical protein [Streptomyces sp. MBT84]